jgi:hypothetical protein
MLIVSCESASHWYFPDGTPLHEVARADGKDTRPTSLRDARKLGLFPSVTNVLSILAKPGLDAWKQVILAALSWMRNEDESLDDFAKRVLTDMTSEVNRAADLGSAFLAARVLWVWQKNYSPVKDSPNAGDAPPPTSLVPA